MSEEPIQSTESISVESEATAAMGITPEAITPDISAIIPAEYAEKGWVKDVKDIPTLFKMTDDLKSQMGKRPAGIPHDEASPEEIAAFNKAFGVPESADGYELPEAKEGAEDFQKAVKGMFLEAGLNQKQAAALASAYDKLSEQFGVQDPEALDADFDKVSKEVFGERDEEVMKVGKALISENVPEALADKVDGLSNDALLVLAGVLDNIQSKYISEDDLPRPQNTTTSALSKEDISAKASTIMKSEAWRNSFDPGHDAAVAEVNRLYSQLNR